ncbi:Alcohol dehydrogenase transcription factor Myb/SANT-like [Popillia japonica]|uniref:Alcohol dehydrogenase transcription factor Myb/SANT-like n=1 Tax=Popillia japonica TaxID=7064 RepID=A0AAW1K3J7_POPJA
MDKEKLITAVFIRNVVWDKTNKSHHNSLILSKLWIEIAEECKTSVPLAKGQWKRLRETFSKKYAALPAKRSGDEAGDIEKNDWPYFETLLFLKDQYTPRETTGNLESIIDEKDQYTPRETTGNLESIIDDNEAEYSESGSTPDVVEDDVQSQVPIPSPSLNSPLSANSPASTIQDVTSSSKRKKKEHSIGEALLKAEHENLEYLRQKEHDRLIRKDKETDEDVAFFNSILPHVRVLNVFFQQKEKMGFRIRVMQLLEETKDTSTFFN